jgi:hypothetical protein
MDIGTSGVSNLLGTSFRPQVAPELTLLNGQNNIEETTNLFGGALQRTPSAEGQRLNSATESLRQFITDNVDESESGQLLSQLDGLEKLATLNGEDAGLDPALSLLQGNNSLAASLPAGSLINQLV